MRIESNELIAGHPSIAVRQLLRRGTGYEWNAALVQNVLAVHSEDAAAVIRQLESLGFIRRIPGKNRAAALWSNTVRGNALANATAAKPVRRSTAERALQEFLARVQEVNQNPEYLYSVRYAVVFGSYLSDSLTVNDVHVAIDLESERGRSRGS